MSRRNHIIYCVANTIKEKWKANVSTYEKEADLADTCKHFIKKFDIKKNELKNRLLSLIKNLGMNNIDTREGYLYFIDKLYEGNDE